MRGWGPGVWPRAKCGPERRLVEGTDRSLISPWVNRLGWEDTIPKPYQVVRFKNAPCVHTLCRKSNMETDNRVAELRSGTKKTSYIVKHQYDLNMNQRNNPRKWDPWLRYWLWGRWSYGGVLWKALRPKYPFDQGLRCPLSLALTRQRRSPESSLTGYCHKICDTLEKWMLMSARDFQHL